MEIEQPVDGDGIGDGFGKACGDIALESREVGIGISGLGGGRQHGEGGCIGAVGGANHLSCGDLVSVVGIIKPGLECCAFDVCRGEDELSFVGYHEETEGGGGKVL